MANYLKSLLKSKKGEESVSMLITIFIRVMITGLIFIFLLEMFSIVLHKQSVDYISKNITKTIEQDGMVSGEAYEYLAELNESLGTEASFYVTDVRYFNNAQKKIQFRDSFKVVVTDPHEFVILSPIGGSDVVFSFDISSSVSGRSEVYWK